MLWQMLCCSLFEHVLCSSKLSSRRRQPHGPCDRQSWKGLQFDIRRRVKRGMGLKLGNCTGARWMTERRR